ncbi:hypothetical protein [Moorena sp. SIO4G3]|uniref:hypothetical protein n=1 Tax=Moorena sp. SIO4G3 TaxID=2607821 RepID=UPI00142BF7C6|nr:hypothetical protein [Moorena sp. SIO4G3]NEO77103.1 hypothetical protein [Moorena sp. SIO4G3]
MTTNTRVEMRLTLAKRPRVRVWSRFAMKRSRSVAYGLSFRAYAIALYSAFAFGHASRTKELRCCC